MDSIISKQPLYLPLTQIVDLNAQFTTQEKIQLQPFAILSHPIQYRLYHPTLTPRVLHRIHKTRVTRLKTNCMHLNKRYFDLKDKIISTQVFNQIKDKCISYIYKKRTSQNRFSSFKKFHGRQIGQYSLGRHVCSGYKLTVTIFTLLGPRSTTARISQCFNVNVTKPLGQ